MQNHAPKVIYSETLKSGGASQETYCDLNKTFTFPAWEYQLSLRMSSKYQLVFARISLK